MRGGVGLRGIRRPARRRGRGLCWTLLLLVLSAVLGDLSLRPVLEELARNRAEQLAARTVAAAVSRLEEERPELFEGLASIEEYGDVRALRVNAAAVNRLKTAATLAVTEAFDAPSALTEGIPLGSLTRIQLLSGLGPDVPVRLRMAGAVSCGMNSEFRSGGLNQTVHRLTFEFRMNLTVLLPLRALPVSCATEFLVCETVMVGDVPF